jgi:hypothetical protein
MSAFSPLSGDQLTSGEQAATAAFDPERIPTRAFEAEPWPLKKGDTCNGESSFRGRQPMQS